MKLHHSIAIALVALASVTHADTAPPITAESLVQRLEKQDPDLVVLDVRTPEEFAAGHVRGAVNIPHDQLPNRIAEITGSKNKEVVVYCRTGKRAAIAEQTLAANGFKRIRHLEGDMIKWQEEKRPLQK